MGKYPKIDLKTDRTNSTTNEREETTLKKVVSAETWFRGEMDPGCCGEVAAWVTEKDERRERSAQRHAWGKHFLLAAENKRG